jgi:hypothetical protein
LPIQEEEVEHKYNVDYHSIEKICGTINKVLAGLEPLPIGHIERSILTPTQFFTQRDPSQWMLCNGQSCAGTAYATESGNSAVPSAENYFLRMQDGGAYVMPEVDSTFGNTYDDSVGNHGHTIALSANQTPLIMGTGGKVVGAGAPTPTKYFPTSMGGLVNVLSITPANSTPGGTESAPDNFLCNFFIRVN